MGKVRSDITGFFCEPGTDGFSWKKYKNDHSHKMIKTHFQPKTGQNFYLFGNYRLLWSIRLISGEQEQGQLHSAIHFFCLCHILSGLGFLFLIHVDETLCDTDKKQFEAEDVSLLNKLALNFYAYGLHLKYTSLSSVWRE